jgi:hypothetical protein
MPSRSAITPLACSITMVRATVGHRRHTSGVGIFEPKTALDDVTGNLGDRAIVAKGVRAEPDQCLIHGHAKLHRDHPGGLVHDETEVGTSLEVGAHLTGAGAGLGRDDGPGGDAGEDLRISLLIGGQRSGPIPIQVERAHIDRTELDRDPNTARAPASTAAAANADQRVTAGSARSGSLTGRWSR